MARRISSQELDAAVILVAHDRWFLESVGTSVLELEARQVALLQGPLACLAQGARAPGEVALGKAIEKGSRPRSPGWRFSSTASATRRGKAKQAQSKVKKIDKIKGDERCPSTRKTNVSCGSSSRPPERASRVVMKLVNGSSRYPGRDLLDDANLLIERDEHVVLVGPNGAGKTTLIETLAGEREPAGGKVRLGHNAKVGYLSQHADTAAGEGPSSTPPRARPVFPARRCGTCSGPSSSPAATSTSRSPTSPAASSAGSRWRSWSLPAPTC